jgi:hypothetical protein
MKLIRNSLIAFLLLLALHETLTRYVDPKPAFQGMENLWIGNYIVAQEYIYDHADAPVVIAGSSLSTRLYPNLLPRETFNLSFNGLSPFDGVNIVLGANTHPHTVFIESNLLRRNSDPDFDEGMLSPRPLTTKRWMISLRDFARPVTLAKNYLRIHIDRTWSFLVGPSARDVQAAPLKGNADVMFDRVLADEKRYYAAPLSKDAQAKLITELGVDIAALEQRGIRVVFFEMPINPALCETSLETSIRNLIRTQFPAEPYFRIGDCNAVTTVDGTHLSWPEAEPVTRQFAEIVRQTIH